MFCCKFNCALLNARSLVNKLLDFKTLAVTDKIDIFFITETWLGDCMLDSELLSPEYQIFRRDRNRNGGGVLFGCSKTLISLRR